MMISGAGLVVGGGGGRGPVVTSSFNVYHHSVLSS